jgi:hypothetical protein
MNTVHVAMGEMGVIMGTHPIPQYLATLGASPCVIYAVWLDHPIGGKTSILAHVHRGSKIADLQARIEQVMQFNTGYTMRKAYITTELFKDTPQRQESGVQLQIIERLELMTVVLLKLAAQKDLQHSAAILEHATGNLTLHGDNNAPFAGPWVNFVFRETNRQREFAFDGTLQIADDHTPMRVQVGLNQWDLDNLD